MPDTYWKIHTKAGTVPADHITGDWPDSTIGERTQIRVQFFPAGSLSVGTGDSLGTLTVAAGSTYTIPAGTTEVYNDTTVDGTLEVEGTLVVDADINYAVTAVEWYDSLSVADGATIGIYDAGELYTGDEESRWGDIDAIADYAGHAATGRSINHVPWIREQLTAEARVPSIVVGFEPADDLKDRGTRGFWGLVESGNDARNAVLSRYAMDLELTYLAEFDDYDSPGAVLADLGA